MSETTQIITCDGCGNDITTTGNSVDYRLSLRSEPKPSWGGAVTDMMIYPSLKSNKHFCGLGCLDKWTTGRMIKRREDAKLEADAIEALLAQHPNAPEGRYISKPMPKDTWGTESALPSQWREKIVKLRKTAATYL
jgi:hypothetical protein